MSYTVRHIYRKKNTYGGIETHINNHLFYGVKFGIKSEYVDNITYDKNTIIVFHSIQPTLVIKILLYSIYSKSKYVCVPHFHAPKYTKKPVLYSIYLYLVGFIFRKYKVIDKCIYIFQTIYEKEKFEKYLNIKCANYKIISPTVRESHIINKIPDKKYHFISISRNDQVKRIDLFLDLVDKYKNQKFILIGNKWDINPRSNLEIHEKVCEKEKYNLIAESKYYISTSEYEALGLSIAEAEYMGVPAICRTSTGYIYASNMNDKRIIYNSDQELIHKIKNIINISNEEYRKMSHSAHKRAKKISWEYEFIKFVKIYENCFSNNNNI